MQAAEAKLRVSIVGGGLAGLATALHLVQSGRVKTLQVGAEC